MSDDDDGVPLEQLDRLIAAFRKDRGLAADAAIERRPVSDFSRLIEHFRAEEWAQAQDAGPWDANKHPRGNQKNKGQFAKGAGGGGGSGGGGGAAGSSHWVGKTAAAAPKRRAKPAAEPSPGKTGWIGATAAAKPKKRPFLGAAPKGPKVDKATGVGFKGGANAGIQAFGSPPPMPAPANENGGAARPAAPKAPRVQKAPAAPAADPWSSLGVKWVGKPAAGAEPKGAMQQKVEGDLFKALDDSHAANVNTPGGAAKRAKDRDTLTKALLGAKKMFEHHDPRPTLKAEAAKTLAVTAKHSFGTAVESTVNIGRAAAEEGGKKAVETAVEVGTEWLHGVAALAGAAAVLPALGPVAAVAVGAFGSYAVGKIAEKTGLTDEAIKGFLHRSLDAVAQHHERAVWNRKHPKDRVAGPGLFQTAKKILGIKPKVEGLRTDFGGDEKFALDEGSVRSFDRDGHLHIKAANISKAAINPYIGREIPGWRELGLDENRVYRLLRHPDELRKGAKTFIGKPILLKHTPIASDDHPFEKVVGAVGTQVRFTEPYLSAPLTFWPGEAIDAIKSGRQRELSCGYRYRADMTPGWFNGAPYDGVMRDIEGNHVAIVREGRAGPDVVVGDSKENIIMATRPRSVKAATAMGRSALQSLAAQYGIAEDGRMEGLLQLLDALGGGEMGGGAGGGMPDLGAGGGDLGIGGDPMAAGGEVDQNDAGAPDDPMAAGPGGDPMAAGGAPGGDPIEQVKDFLRGILTPEQMQQLDQLVAQIGGGSAPPAEAGAPPDDGGGAPPDGAGGPPSDKDDASGKPPAQDCNSGGSRMTKPAMDAASVEERATKAAIRIAREIRDATTLASKYVGEINVACDSAEAVYRQTLKMLGRRDANTLHSSALRAVIELHKPLSRGSAPPRIASDAAASPRPFDERWPEVARIGRA